MRKALVVGIDYYESIPSLAGCVNDAHAVKTVLDRHSDGSVNFHAKLLAGTGSSNPVSRQTLRDSIRELFKGDSDIALLYFAGHGYIEVSGGYICSSDCKSGDDSVALADVITYANRSEAKNKVIILDSCHSGVAGKDNLSAASELTTGMTILAASTEDQYATEENGSGIFTTLLVDALNGAGANLVGDVTPGSVYAHVDQSLGAWAQRPVFKTNVKKFVSLRQTAPPIPLTDLRRLTELFPAPGCEYPLNPSYEPERCPGDESKPGYVAPDPDNTAVFAILQKLNRVNLVVPVDAPHMWHAAVESKACKLTVLGEHYRRLVEKGLI